MELDRFLNLVAATLGALGSIYVLKSFIAMTPKVAADLATPRWGFSIPILDSLSEQRADSIVGAAFFVLALGLGIIGLIFAPQDLVFPSKAFGLLAAGTVLLSAILAGALLAKALRKSHKLKGRQVLLSHSFDDVVVKKRFEQAFLDSVKESATFLLGLQFASEDSNLDVIRKVAGKLGRHVPPDVVEGLSLPPAA